jgi:RHS repeat-associated protein
MDYYDPIAMTDATGDVVERYEFSAFGLRSVRNGTWAPLADTAYAVEFAFHGQFLDLETGYYNYGYRYYSPPIGRWLSKDPIEESGGVNMYLFAGNGAANQFDYLGLISADECKSTPSEALVSACREFGPISANHFIEYGGVIMDCSSAENENCYKYTYVAGTPSTVEAAAISASTSQAECCTPRAVWHTHPRYTVNHPVIISLLGQLPQVEIDAFIVLENIRQDLFSADDINFVQIGEIQVLVNGQEDSTYGPPIRLGLCGSNGTIRVLNDGDPVFTSSGEQYAYGIALSERWL